MYKPTELECWYTQLYSGPEGHDDIQHVILQINNLQSSDDLEHTKINFSGKIIHGKGELITKNNYK